jgi:hypothetical protein
MRPLDLMVRFSGTQTPAEDQTVAFRDTFEDGAADVEDRGWLWYQEGLVSTQAIAAGELNIQVTEGGAAGSFWFDANDGVLLYRIITGDCDVRARIRVLNTAGDAPPPPESNYRLVVLAAHDPDRSTVLNYAHVGAGSTAQADNRVEWKTTDDSTSTFGDNGVGITTPIAVDVRLVRAGQVFTAYWRDSSGDLSSSTGWTELQVMDRSDNTTPVRTTAAPLPDTLQWGIAVYSNQATHVVQGFVEETWATR